MTKRAAFVLLLVLGGIGSMACQRPPAGPTTVLIVRHGEKASQDADAPLSDAGRQRAVALAETAADAGVAAIYSSQFTRTKDTARPLSERTGVAVTEFPVNLSDPGDYGKRLATEILAKHAGQTVVVVSHQNTIPALVEGLAGRGEAPLGDAEYDRLTIVTVLPGGAAHQIVARYGAPST
jgi:broad specificity phosphatase PhoE